MSRNQRRQTVVQQKAPAAQPEKPAVDLMFKDAVAHHMAGRDDEAERIYLGILAVPPVQAETSYNLGLLYQTKGRLMESVAAYRNCILMRHDHVDAMCNMATALQNLGHLEEAVGLYHKAIAIKPEFAMAYCNLGVALKEHHQAEASKIAYQRAIQLRPDYDWAYANLSAVLLDLGLLEESIAACKKAIELNGQMPMAYFNLGAAYKSDNRLSDAEAAFRQGLAVNPDFVEAHFTLGQVLLHQGKYAEGWQEYDWRWRLPQYSWLKNIHGDIQQPKWQGEDIRGKTLLIYAEQGLGDAMQYVRYVPMVAATTGAKVVLAVHPPLKKLFAQLEGIEVTTLDMPFPPFDLHCPLLTLPRLFGTSAHNIPANVPYLKAYPDDIARWKIRMDGHPGKKVGIVWSGNPDQSGDRLRSPRLAAVQPLFKVPGITYYALQLGAGRKDIETLGLPDNVVDLGLEIRDLADTAAIMANLDLMISSCTAPLHLSAALGVPTWGMIPYAPHFLWLLGRTDNDWYPTLRLYHQKEAGTEWDNVMSAVAADLQRL